MPQNLPSELWIQVQSYLEPHDLFRVSLSSKYFYAVQDNTTLWKPLCLQLWKDKCVPPELYYRCNYSLIMNQLSIKEIQRILELRNEPTWMMIEKSEFVEAMNRTNPKDIPACNYNKWKASFFSSLVDSKREMITTLELCRTHWMFKFHSWSGDHTGAFAKFYEDGTFETAIYPDRFHWRFSAGGIQMEEFPVITFKRLSDWSWELENLVGMFVQQKESF